MPVAPRFDNAGSKLWWGAYPGIEISGSGSGSNCALGIISVIIIVSGSLSAIIINRSSLLLGNWSAFV